MKKESSFLYDSDSSDQFFEVLLTTQLLSMCYVKSLCTWQVLVAIVQKVDALENALRNSSCGFSCHCVWHIDIFLVDVHPNV